MNDCLFCKIIAGEIPSAKVYEDEHVYAFRDINPQAPLHVLVVPRMHVATLNDLGADHDRLVGVMVRRAAAIAEERGFKLREHALYLYADCTRDNCPNRSTDE